MEHFDFIDLSNVSPQSTFLESHPEKTPATSSLYSTRFTTRNADGSENHTLVGAHLTLAKGDPNGLWEALHIDRGTQRLDPKNPKMATRSLLISCDTLEVLGEFSLPEADVAIFSRRVIWATPDAAINTSPLPWAVDKAKNAERSTSSNGENGAHGRNAGSFRVFAAMVEPDNDSRPRLIALGGQGQDPGAGLDGEAGKDMASYSSVPFKISDSGISTSKATVTFDPVAVFIDYEWRWALSQVASGKLGEDSFPTNGSDALAPGIPGNGGNGGGLCTNQADLATRFTTAGGKSGAKERDYRGGRAGAPTSCAKYKVKLWENLFGTDNASTEKNSTATNTTKQGANASAAAASRLTGESPQTEISAAPNAWLHPLGVQKALEYIRDLFLAGEREEAGRLLAVYEEALGSPMPRNLAWNDDSLAYWNSAQSEVASMQQRLRGHLDYFGNAAGYTPLLSLQGSIKLYEEETRRALRTLLLVSWIGAREREAREAAHALGEAVVTLNDDTKGAAEAVVTSEARISETTKRMDSLEQELNSLGNQLETLRNNLLSKAQNNLQMQAQIKFSIRIAAAICQVIPVGQPALGTIGSLAGVASDFVGEDESKTPDTISKMADVLTKAREAAKKAKDAGAKAGKEKGEAPAKDAKGAKEKSSAWAKVGDGLGPALSLVSQAVKALQVPKSEVEAELQRLESESTEWNDMVKKIRALNTRKADLLGDLQDAFQSLGEGYGRISSNSAAIFSMQQERAREIGKLDPAADGFVRQMGQRSRMTLLRYLYLMVRSYETTVLKPIDVDWKLCEVTDKINDLVKPEAGFDAASLNQQVEALAPLYQKNIDTVRTSLLQDFCFNEKTITLQMGLSQDQTPEILNALNADGEIMLDPLRFGLVLPDCQLSRLNGISLTALEFDPSAPHLPETHNVVISLQPARSGTIRKGENLYSVYSDEPLSWSWTKMATGEIQASAPSVASQDILNLVLGSGAEKIKQKIALPPLWSDLRLRLLYSPNLPPGKKPRVSRLFFRFFCDVSPAPDYQCVLNVQSQGTTGGAVIDCSPTDMAARGNGCAGMVRIYSQGSQVSLAVPPHAAGSVFEAWDLLGQKINLVGDRRTEVSFKLDDHVLALCNWRMAAEEAPPVVLMTMLAPAEMAELAEIHGDENVCCELKRVLAAEPEARDIVIRAEPSDDAQILGLIPSLNAAELLEQDEEGWKLVNYRGIVGWVNG